MWGQFAVALALAGCIGRIDEAPSSVAPAAITCRGTGRLGPAPLRRLTPAELTATLKDLLRLPAAPRVSESAPYRGPDSGFDNDIANLTVSSVVVEGQLTDAEVLAKQVAADPAKLLPCDPKTVDDA